MTSNIPIAEVSRKSAVAFQSNWLKTATPEKLRPWSPCFGPTGRGRSSILDIAFRQVQSAGRCHPPFQGRPASSAQDTVPATPRYDHKRPLRWSRLDPTGIRRTPCDGTDAANCEKVSFG